MAAALAALVFGLSACQPVPQPFANDRASSSRIVAPRGEIGGVAVLRVFGVPDETSRALSEALAEALGRHDIPAAPGAGNRRSKFVQGVATTRPAGDRRVEVDIVWDLFDRGGTLIGSRRHSEVMPESAWRDGRRAAMRALTGDVAGELAALVHGASRDADERVPIPLHVWPVAGAPAGDNAALQRAMESALRRRDFTVTSGLDGARLIVAGALRLGAAEAEERPIEVTWSVLDADGQELGKLTQRNAVPAAALEVGWKTLAAVIAESAAGGVSDLLRRLPPSAWQGASKGAKRGL